MWDAIRDLIKAGFEPITVGGFIGLGFVLVLWFRSRQRGAMPDWRLKSLAVCLILGVGWRILIQAGSGRYYAVMPVLFIFLLCAILSLPMVSRRVQALVLLAIFALGVAGVGRAIFRRSNYVYVKGISDSLRLYMGDGKFNLVLASDKEMIRYRYYADRENSGVRFLEFPPDRMKEELDAVLPEYDNILLPVDETEVPELYHHLETYPTVPEIVSLGKFKRSQSRAVEILQIKPHNLMVFGREPMPYRESQIAWQEDFSSTKEQRAYSPWEQADPAAAKAGIIAFPPELRLVSVTSSAAESCCPQVGVESGMLRTGAGEYRVLWQEYHPLHDAEVLVRFRGQQGSWIRLLCYWAGESGNLIRLDSILIGKVYDGNDVFREVRHCLPAPPAGSRQSAPGDGVVGRIANRAGRIVALGALIS
jgi:hypothetical protein